MDQVLSVLICAIYHFALPVEECSPLFGTLEGESAETAFVRINSLDIACVRCCVDWCSFMRGKGSP